MGIVTSPGKLDTGRTTAPDPANDNRRYAAVAEQPDLDKATMGLHHDGMQHWM